MKKKGGEPVMIGASRKRDPEEEASEVKETKPEKEVKDSTKESKLKVDKEITEAGEAEG